MKFHVLINRWANFYFFIANLSEWHFSCRKRYNFFWLAADDKFSKTEKKYLKIFKKILLKYHFFRYLGILFSTKLEKKDWIEAAKLLNKNEYKTFNKVFAIFEQRFNKIWNPTILKQNAKILQKELKSKYCKEIQKDLKIFLGENKIKQVNIYLLKHPAENWYLAGGANIGNNKLTLECNELRPNEASVELAAATVWHEFIHLAYQQKIEKEINRIITVKKQKQINLPLIQKRSLKEALSEIIIFSLFPKGYLADKYLHYQPYKKIKQQLNEYLKIYKQFRKGKLADFNVLRFYFIYKLYPLTKKYIQNKKQIDEDYIKTVLKYLGIKKTG
ncbi:MAG: hypothetical protein AABX44_00305 [Nanoarchaeota archaeon]